MRDLADAGQPVDPVTVSWAASRRGIVPPVQTRPLDAGGSVPCPARGWQVLASPDVR
jgi:hypothetical protein